MTVELTPQHQSPIERVIHSGGYHDAQEVIGAALAAFAQEADDVFTIKTREREPRANWPRTHDPLAARNLQGHQRGWRIRMEDYRVVYTIDDAEKHADIVRTGHRKEAYES